MHTAVSPNETKTKQNAAPQAEAVEPAAPSSPPDGTDGEATGGASGTQALLQPDEQLQALLAENEALRKENQELLLRCDAFEKESIGKTDDIRRQLTELKTALTDRVYLLVCAYEETIEKIDSLIESLPAEIARDARRPRRPKHAPWIPAPSRTRRGFPLGIAFLPKRRIRLRKKRRYPLSKRSRTILRLQNR